MTGERRTARRSVAKAVAYIAIGAAVAAAVFWFAFLRQATESPTTAAPEPEPAAETAGPTSEECARVRERFEEVSFEGVMHMLLDRVASDPKSTTTSSLDVESADPARVLSDEEYRLMDACYLATEAACARLYELVATRSAPTEEAIADCSAACETYPHTACGPPCVSGHFGFGDLFDEDAPGGCTRSPICDPANDWRLSQGSTSSGHPWDLRSPGWVPPTPECVPICDIDRDGFATARDYAGECTEVAAWLKHDCETQVAPYRALDRSLGEAFSRSLAVCQDADLAGMATLPPTLWQDASILQRSSSGIEHRGEPPNIDLLTHYRCAGRLTDPCIDYSR